MRLFPVLYTLWRLKIAENSKFSIQCKIEKRTMYCSALIFRLLTQADVSCKLCTVLSESETKVNL